jgi:hypothetical protein
MFNENCFAFLDKLKGDNSKTKIAEYAKGRLSSKELSCTSNRVRYAELQFHGAIDFRRDILEIIVEGSERDFAHIRPLAEKWGIPIKFVSEYYTP